MECRQCLSPVVRRGWQAPELVENGARFNKYNSDRSGTESRGCRMGQASGCRQGEIVFSSNLRDSRNFPVQRPFDSSAGLALATISRRCLRLGVSQSFSLGSRVLSNASISSIASVDDVPHARHVACDRAVEGGDEAQFWNEGRDFAAHEECCGHAVPSGKMRLKNVVRLLPKPRGSRLWRGLLWGRGGGGKSPDHVKYTAYESQHLIPRLPASARSAPLEASGGSQCARHHRHPGRAPLRGGPRDACVRILRARRPQSRGASRNGRRHAVDGP